MASNTSSASSNMLPTSSLIGAPTPTSSTSSNATFTAEGLSTGAAAGIGIGATLGAPAAGLLVYFVIRSYCQEKRGVPEIPIGEVSTQEPKPAELGQDWALEKGTGTLPTVTQSEIAEIGQGLRPE